METKWLSEFSGDFLEVNWLFVIIKSYVKVKLKEIIIMVIIMTIIITPPAAVQQRGQGLGSISRFSKEVINNLLVKELGRIVLNKLPNLYSKGTSKIKTKKLKRILQSDIANSLIDMALITADKV